MFQIEILKVGVENKGKYKVAIVDHKTSDGKIDSKKVVSFVNKDVFTTLSKAQSGEKFDVNSVKDDNGYWQWTSVVPTGQIDGAASAKTPSTAFRSSYETTEERAARQVYIVRQSSIANAIEFTGGQSKGLSVEDVLEVAKQFEDYVFGNVTNPVEVE